MRQVLELHLSVKNQIIKRIFHRTYIFFVRSSKSTDITIMPIPTIKNKPVKPSPVMKPVTRSSAAKHHQLLPAPSPINTAEEEEEDDRQYMMLRHSDDEANAADGKEEGGEKEGGAGGAKEEGEDIGSATADKKEKDKGPQVIPKR